MNAQSFEMIAKVMGGISVACVLLSFFPALARSRRFGLLAAGAAFAAATSYVPLLFFEVKGGTVVGLALFLALGFSTIRRARCGPKHPTGKPLQIVTPSQDQPSHRI